MRHLHWFQNDLRLADNAALLSACDAESLLCLYLLPKPRPWCNLTGIGPQRNRFLRESLQALREALQELGQDLMVLEGSPELVIPQVVERFSIDTVSTSQTPGWYETQALQFLAERLPVPLTVHPGNTLFTPDQFPFSWDEYPATFSPFRRKVEQLAIAPLLWSPEKLPPPPAAQFDAIPVAAASPHPGLPLPGGRTAGLRRLDQFLFQEAGIVDYKSTRNDLNGLAGSSTLSPWIANGALSVKEVAHEIGRAHV